MPSQSHAVSSLVGRFSRFARAAITPLGVTSTVVIAAVWIAFVNEPYAGPGIVATITLLMIASGLIVIAVHELGHFLVSRAVGFRTISLTIGPIRFVNTRQGVRIRSADGWQLGGGVLVCLPRDGVNLRSRWMSVVAAGPVASLLLAVSGWLISPPFGFDRDTIQAIASAVGPVAAGWWVALLPTVSIVSFFAGVASLIPSRRGLLLTDGAQLRLLARGGAEAERWCAQIMLTAAARGGVRPREWDRAWIERVTAPRDESAHEALGHLGAFYWALDAGHPTLAAEHLARAHGLLGTLPPLVQALVHLDTAFFDARVHGSLASARAELSKAEVPGVPRFARLRSEAAVLLLEGDRAEASVKAREGLEALAELEREELVRFPAEEEWLRSLAADAEISALASDPLTLSPAAAPHR